MVRQEGEVEGLGAVRVRQLRVVVPFGMRAEPVAPRMAVLSALVEHGAETSSVS